MKRVIPWLIVIGGAIALGGLVGLNPLIGAGGFIGLVLLFLFFAFPDIGIALAIAAAMLQYLLTRAFPVLPQQAVLVDDMIMVGVVLRLFVDLALQRVKVSWWLLGPVAAFLAVAAVGVLANKSDLVTVVNSLRALVLPVIMMPAAAAYLDTPDRRSAVVKMVVTLTTINAVMATSQWVLRPTSPDSAFGFLGPGGANGAGFLALIGLVLTMLAPWPFRRRAILMVILGTGLLVSSARAAILASPVALLVAGWRTTGRTRARRTASVLLVVALTLGLSVYYRSAGRDINAELSPQALLAGQQIAGQGGRLLYLTAVPTVWAQSSDLAWLWGVGAGGYTSFVGMNRLAPAFVAQARTRTDSLTGFAFPDMQLTALLGEYGILGTLLAFGILLVPAWQMRRYFKRELRGYDQTLIVSLPALLVVWLVGMVAINIMEYQPAAVPLWIIMGATAGACFASDSELAESAPAEDEANAA